MPTTTRPPWARVDNPMPIPEPLTAELLAALSDREFTTLVHDNLLPGKTNRVLWGRLWELLKQDLDLKDAAFDVLERYLDEVEDAMADTQTKTALGQPVDPLSRRQAKFHANLESAWERLERGRPRRMLPYSPTFHERLKTYNAPSRRAVTQLLTRIYQHRQEVGAENGGDADHELWAVLSDYGF